VRDKHEGRRRFDKKSGHESTSRRGPPRAHGSGQKPWPVGWVGMVGSSPAKQNPIPAHGIGSRPQEAVAV
jgi:hypothetical protein